MGCAIDLPVFEAVPETESSFPIQRILANGIDIKFRRASIQQKCEEAYFPPLVGRKFRSGWNWATFNR